MASDPYGKFAREIGRIDEGASGWNCMAESKNAEREPLYCPACEAEVPDPLVCGDCGAVICRKCGTPLEKIDELGIG
jgi:hypothetical protein